MGNMSEVLERLRLSREEKELFEEDNKIVAADSNSVGNSGSAVHPGVVKKILQKTYLMILRITAIMTIQTIAMIVTMQIAKSNLTLHLK